MINAWLSALKLIPVSICLVKESIWIKEVTDI